MRTRDWIYFICISSTLAGAVVIGNEQIGLRIPAYAVALISLPSYIYAVIKGLKRQLEKDGGKE